ncbi:hypothetical protein TNCV_4875581 [Trichonephila clavipes]|nr:hypothetical protein TNCV_4875581 [Trichonephila clavipes]
MNSVASTLNRVADMEFNNQISVLTPNNWNTWKHDMQVLLMHYGCWQFIVQTKPEQPDEEATYKEKIRSTTSWKEEDFRVVKIEAELILEANCLQVDETRFGESGECLLEQFHLKKSKTLPGATAAAHGDPNGKNDYQKKGGKISKIGMIECRWRVQLYRRNPLHGEPSSKLLVCRSAEAEYVSLTEAEA